MEKINKKIKGLIVGSALLFMIFGIFPSATQAANLYFSPSFGSYIVGRTFSVNVYLSTNNQVMNAASGIISFPADKLEIISLSKANSIFSLWVQEPSFSNNAGTVNFEGIVLNPGFTGSNGKIITITFRVKAGGNALINFSTGSILANDGKGTNILISLGSGSFSLGQTELLPEKETPSTIVGTPAAVKISSPTHPDSNNWYSNNNPKFTWQNPLDIIGLKLLYNKQPFSNPSVLYSQLISKRQLENIPDGIYYFHIQLRNKIGWGRVSHFKFKIDTQPPNSFKIEVKEGKETISPEPTLSFKATDEMSGIDHYQIIINNKESIKTNESEYKISLQDLGKHAVIVKAVDKAGNETLAMTEIEILAIDGPIITDYPHELLPGSILSIKGTALPESTVIIFIQKDKEEIKKKEIKSDKEGNWFFIEVEPVEKGVYQVWAETIDSFGAKSRPSEKINILVNPPIFIRIGKLAIDYLTTIITLLILILAITLIIFWAWQKIKKEKIRLKKEISKTEKALYLAFNDLKEETEKQVAKLDGKPGLSEREKNIYNNLKNSLKISEKFIGKKINDIERK